jgi:Sec-independent protein translocase protein TatA
MFDGPVAWIFLIVGLIFIFGGSKRLADLGKGFGSFMHEFNKAKREGEEGEKKAAVEAKPGQVIDEKAPEPGEKK